MRAPVHFGQGAVGKVARVVASTCQAIVLCLALLLSLPTLAAVASNSVHSTAVSGHIFPDFTLAATNAAAGQRLFEQRGAPVMLLVLDKCDRCEKSLVFFTQLAERYQSQELVSWVIWTPHNKQQPPHLNIPVLNAHSHSSLPFEGERPQIYFINRDGKLAQRLSGSLRSLAKTTEPILETWMPTQARPVKP